MNNNNSKKILILFLLIFLIWANIPNILLGLGKSNLKKQNYSIAIKRLRQAYKLDNDNKDIRYYYAQALIKLKPTFDIQKEVFELANGQINDSAAILAQDQIESWKNNIFYNIGDNYIEQAPYEKGIIRWDTDKFPLKIIISDKSDMNIPQYYEKEITNAFLQWSQSVNFLKFSIVENNADANIEVKIVPTPSNICSGNTCKYVVGYTNPEIKNNKLKKMTITLYATDPQGNYFSDKELYNTILHEIGHALGVMGHSYSSEDLMYMTTDNGSYYAPYRSSFQYISSKDINTMKLLYKIKPTISNTNPNKFTNPNLIYAPIILGTTKEISSRKLSEAKQYIKKAPDIYGGYVDLAVAYAELNKKKEAVKSLEKAMELTKSDTEKYIVLYNLAVIHMNSNDLEKALTYANQAKNLQDDEDIQELIMNINHAISSKTKPFKNNMIK